MNGYNFSDRVRRVLAMAREESSSLQHEYVGTEHMLLALIRERDGVSAQVLKNFDVNVEALRRDVTDRVQKGKSGQATGPDLPYTSRAKRVLELAMKEARDLSHSYVGTEHLLLGLIAEERGIAAQVMAQHRLTAVPVRTEVLRLLGSEARSEPPMQRAQPTTERRVVSVYVEIRFEDESISRHESRSLASAMAFLQTQ